MRRIAELIDQYADLGRGGTDASLIAIAERLNLTTIATLDRRHFGVVRPSHARLIRRRGSMPASCCAGFQLWLRKLWRVEVATVRRRKQQLAPDP